MDKRYKRGHGLQNKNSEAKIMGWWKLTYWTENDVPLTDIDREHIASLITKGYTNGEIIEENKTKIPRRK